MSKLMTGQRPLLTDSNVCDFKSPLVRTGPARYMIGMSHKNSTNEELSALLNETRVIAMVGASSSTVRPSNSIMAMLQDAGYRVIPVNPRETEVHGEKAYPTLADVPVKVDIVNVFRRAEETPPIAADAVKIGARALWLQLGIANDEAAAIAQQGGLAVVMDSCIAVEHRLLRIPRR